MADYKQLCAELLRAMDEIEECEAVDWSLVKTKPLKMANQSMTEARAALAEPEPEEPTDEEILQLSVDCDVTYSLAEGEFCTAWRDGYNMRKEVVSFVRAVLARWGK